MSEKSYLPSGVFLLCDKGVLPTPLVVTWATTTDFLGTNVATERDKLPGANIIPFGACAARYGPCVPTPMAWSPVKDDVIVQGARPLLEDSKLPCSQGGTISVFLSMSAALLRVASNANDALNATVDGAIKSVEDGVEHQFDKADDYLKQLGPPLGDYAREKLGMAEGVWEGASGIVTGLWGLSKMARNLEIKTANAVAYAVENPAETGAALQQGAQRGWSAVTNADNWQKAGEVAASLNPLTVGAKAGTWVSDPANRAKAWNATKAAYAKASTYMADPRNRGKFVGRAGFEIAFALLTGGAGEAANVGKVGEVANALEKGEAAVQSGRVLTGAVAETAEELAAREAAEAGAKQAAKELETVTGANKSSRVCQAEPVDVATGDMIVDAVDVELPGPVPFVWIRTWYSTSQRQGPLGHGWHHSYDLALWQEATGTSHLRLSDGRLATFEPLSAENKFTAYNRAEKLELRPTELGFAVHALDEGFTYQFEAAGPTNQYRLLHVADRHGHALCFSYSELGYLLGITDSVGRAIGVRTDARGRILTLDLPSPDGSSGTFTAVQYAYDEAGDLTTVTDAEGHTAYFAYQAHLLSQRTFRTGISFYFEYDARRRCVHTWGDNNYLNYRFAYAGDSTVIDIAEPASQQTYTHQAGLVTRHVDGVGNVREWYYNPYGELELERDPLAQPTLYDYDSQGNLTAVTYPDGTQVCTNYDHHQPVRFTDVMGNEWHWAYDEAGNQVLRIDATGLATHSAYEAGQLRAVAAAGAQPTILDYDAQLNLRAVRLPDGQQRSWQHDALGRVTVLTDARGNVQRRTYDRLGQLRQVVESDGNVRTLTYDGEGNVIRAQDAFQDVRLSYTGLNWLASRAQAGTQVRYDYNADGDLVRITNEAGRTHEFTLDAAGQVIAETRFDGQPRQFVRDAAGRVVTKLAGQSEQATYYAYDLAGRITATTYPDGSQEQFTYCPDGTLAEARNAEQTVSWERDALGRVLHETQGTHRVSSRYNQAGQRLAITSSLGAAVELERDDYGEVAQVRAMGWQARFERDAQGFETGRTLSGGVQARWQRDALGRPVVQALTTGHQRRRRHYRWQGPNQLTELTDSTTGTTRFAYEAGTLSRTTYPDGEQELRLPDAVGNLFATPTHQDRHYGPGGQLRQAGDTRYQYDELGNLTHKQSANGQHWHYQWNGIGQLTQVTRPDGALVRFAYDALGRRIRKHYRGKVTHWVWDGNQPLHEWTELELDGHNTAEVITWLFEEGSQAPLAKLAGARRYSILTDYLGTPLELVDERGTSAWRAELSSYGQLRHLEGMRAACPFRYQGQYEDAETGLYYNRFRYYDPQAGSYLSQDPIGLDGGLEFYAYVLDPHKQVDLFGLSGTCPLAGRKSNAWNDFQAKTKGQFGSRAESLAEYRRLRAGTNPWPKDYVPTLEKAKIGERVHMAMGAGQPNTLPGAFATKDVIPDVAYVRDNLAVRSDFKKTVDYVQEYQVIKDIDVIRGPVGPQIDPAAGKYLPGGGSQVHFQFPDPPPGVARLDRTQYLKPIGVPKKIK